MIADLFSEKQCRILGFAVGDRSSLANDTIPNDVVIFKEADFAWLLKEKPRGYSIDCEDAQVIFTVSDDAAPAEPSTSQQCK